jgi:ubiquinone/menaquinone biosynthesis C-methylase UbiE
MTSPPTKDIVEREKDFWESTDDAFLRARRVIRASIGEFNRYTDVHDYYDPAGKVVLDYGCGNGDLSFELLERGAKRVVGFDISESLVDEAGLRARQLGVAGQAEFHVADAHDTGFPDATFDLVVGIAILHHLMLPEALLEIRRVLKPGGRATFVEPLQHNPILRLGRAMTPAGRTPDEHPLTQDDWELCRSVFPGFRHYERELLTLLFIPLNWVLPRDGKRWLARRLSSLDDRILAGPEGLRKYARLSILVLE